MSWYPKATRLELPENRTQPRIRDATQIILHSAVDAPGRSSLFGFFRRADVKVESHFFVTLDGRVEQYMDTTVVADANYKANPRAISIETEDDGNPNERPWSSAQLATLRALMVWLCRTEKIPARACSAWDKPGIGYHSQFGGIWTPYRGKTCPGRARIPQVPGLIRSVAAALAAAPVYHTIVQGDTMWNLAQKYRTTVDKLKALNPKVDPGRLVIGSRLRVR